ncbi:thioredoxin family protein [Thiocapsa rosea]|uniref:Thioredoxin 1 n=1 Tax=Thiocapsa rosea TaxID=69360 RepID=A0A495VCD7_9GAMM|nr:thioredoxin family protein [Thiocapsa rosea]RKT47002.1 thioredoxin 1 [Thiocapsa rosea]
MPDSIAGSGAPTALPPAPRATEITADGRPVLVELGSGSCASCVAMHRVLDELEASHGDHLQLVSINILEQPELVRQWKVMAIPTQVFLDGSGREFGRHIGFLSADAIRERFAAAGLPLDAAAGDDS